jgi:hypothetical protein
MLDSEFVCYKIFVTGERERFSTYNQKMYLFSLYDIWLLCFSKCYNFKEDLVKIHNSRAVSPTCQYHTHYDTASLCKVCYQHVVLSAVPFWLQKHSASLTISISLA